MEVSDKFGLEEVLIKSHAPVKSEIPKACFKEIKDLKFEGMSDEYANLYMARVKGSQYLMNASFDRYFVDIDTLTAKKADIGYDMRTLANCFINGKYMLMLRLFNDMAIFRGLQHIGQIEFQTKFEYCKNNQLIHGRYAQQAGNTVYVVDRYGDLYRIEWQDIKEGIDHKKLIKRNVENFYVDKELGMAIVDWNCTLSLDNKVEVDLTKVNTQAKWTIVSCIAKCWIVSGDHKDKASMASISKKGDIRSTLKFKLTSNGYKGNYGRKYGGIYALQKVYAIGMRGIMMAIERDGCCHLISVDYGRLTVLQSIDSIVPRDVVEDEYERIVRSVTATAKRGQFMVGGLQWTRLITVKYK